MPDPLPLPAAAPPRLAVQNITGSLGTTIAAVLVALGQYLAVNGESLPHDSAGWISFGVGAAIAVIGALHRGPQS